MSDTKTASWIAALERARAELEGALSADERRRRLGTSDADWAGCERELGGNPVYRCWVQLNEAIEKLRRLVGAETEAGATTARGRVSLRDVLEHIRSDPALLQGGEPQVAAADGRRSEPSQAAPAGPGPPTSIPAGTATPRAGTGHAPPEAEEATVSFVIRERARPTPPAGQGGDASKEPVPREPPAAPEPEPDLGHEAEVVIVPRRR